MVNICLAGVWYNGVGIMMDWGLQKIHKKGKCVGAGSCVKSLPGPVCQALRITDNNAYSGSLKVSESSSPNTVVRK